MVSEEVLDPDLAQTFTVQRTPHDALDSAQAFLQGAGAVAPALKGRMERFGDQLAVHHGRIRTTITAQECETGTRIEVHRRGQAPLENTRRWILGLGLGGFFVAWGLTFYNERVEVLSPLVTLTLFFLGIVVILGVLFVADRSLERRSEGFVLALQDAIDGDPLMVLQREVDLLERSSALANGFIFYLAGLIIEFLIFVIVLNDAGIKASIDEAAARDAMLFGLLIPIAPALIFAGLYFVFKNRVHRERMALAERRFTAGSETQ